MRADEIRQLYDYHFALNRRVWDESVMALTDEQYIQQLDYSVGSIRNQTVHVMSIDERWFSGLRGLEVPDFLNPDEFPSRAIVRARWDEVEQMMRGYLESLTDEALDSMFEGLAVWQVLLHVLNHGTDHRAQMLAMLHRLDAPTFAQDYVIYLWRKEAR